MSKFLKKSLLILCLIKRIESFSEPIKWKINIPEGLETSTTDETYSSTLASSKIRLVDWREWSKMRPAYSATIGAPPLLIVDTDTILDEEIESSTESSKIPEADDEDFDQMNSTSLETSTITSTSPPQTTTTELISTSTHHETTTSKTSSDLTLELKNLPDILSLLKHLSIIPAVVRSFSSAAGVPSESFGSISTNQAELRSRALSSNSGYSARAPQFVSAPSTDSEVPQTFIGRRGNSQTSSNSQLPPNMPAPIVPVNSRHDSMKPREIGKSIKDLNYFPTPNRLNIYGIDRTSNRGGLVDQMSYSAPIIQPPQEHKKQRPRFDLSNLTVNEVEQLESIHRKLFQQPSKLTENVQQATPENTNSIFVFQKPHQTKTIETSHNILNSLPTSLPASIPALNSIPNSASIPSSASINSSLKPEMINELMMIKDIPDLEELTQGMDLSLLSKPGGFAILKEQFIERLIQRSLVQKRRLKKKMHRNRSH